MYAHRKMGELYVAANSIQSLVQSLSLSLYFSVQRWKPVPTCGEVSEVEILIKCTLQIMTNCSSSAAADAQINPPKDDGHLMKVHGSPHHGDSFWVVLEICTPWLCDGCVGKGDACCLKRLSKNGAKKLKPKHTHPVGVLLHTAKWTVCVCSHGCQQGRRRRPLGSSKKTNERTAVGDCNDCSRIITLLAV